MILSHTFPPTAHSTTQLGILLQVLNISCCCARSPCKILMLIKNVKDYPCQRVQENNFPMCCFSGTIATNAIEPWEFEQGHEILMRPFNNNLGNTGITPNVDFYCHLHKLKWPSGPLGYPNHLVVLLPRKSFLKSFQSFQMSSVQPVCCTTCKRLTGINNSRCSRRSRSISHQHLILKKSSWSF